MEFCLSSFRANQFSPTLYFYMINCETVLQSLVLSRLAITSPMLVFNLDVRDKDISESVLKLHFVSSTFREWWDERLV